MNRRRDHSRGLRAAAALVLIVGAVPVLLVRLANALLGGGTPFSGMTAPWHWSIDQIGAALTEAIDQDTILTTLGRVGLTAAWMAVVVLVANIAVEVWHQRNTGEAMAPITGLGWSQGLAAKIAAGLLALSTSVPSHFAAAAALPARAPAAVVVSATPARPSSSHATTLPALATESWSLYQVTKGDSLYGIAARLAGGDRTKTRDLAQQILERNHGRQMNDGQRFNSPGYIAEGWTLDIPTNPAVAATRIVERGDCYWAIAEDELTDRLDRQPSDSEVYYYTEELLEHNVERLGNRTPASLIHPGDVIVIPGSDAVVQDIPEPAVPPQPAAEEPLPSTTPPPPPAPAAPVATTSPPTTTSSAPAVPSSSTSPTTVQSDGEAIHAVAPHGSAPWKELVVGSLFATAITGTVALLRRRQLAARRSTWRTALPAADAAIAEKVLTLEARADRVDALARLLPTIGIDRNEPGDTLVRAIQLDADQIEVLWSQPRPHLKPGWATVNDGASWTHPYPPTIDKTGRRPAVVLPTLVGLGTRDAGELLLDLEAAGSVALIGDSELAEALSRQMVWTLATTPLADTLDVRLVGIQPPATATSGRLRTASLHDAARWAAARADELQTSTRQTKAGSIFDSRLRHPQGDWDPVITIVNLRGVEPAAHPALDQLLEAARPGSGIAVVLLGEHPAARERIETKTATDATWQPAGVPFTPHLLTQIASGAVAALVDDAARIETNPVLLDDPSAPPDYSADDAARPAHDVLVRVIGEITVEGATAPLSEAETELLALLACLRPAGPVNIDRLATMLAHDEWRTPNLRTIKARVSDVRSKLGAGSDGKPLVPDARVGNNSPGRYTVSCRVLTDIDLLEAARDRAAGLSSSEATAVLTDALRLMRGRPFAARSGYEWAAAEQQILRTQRAVLDVTVRLVELATEARDTATIQVAVAKAAGCLDDPLAEFAVRCAEARAAMALGDPSLVRSALDYSQVLAAEIDDIAGDFELGDEYSQAIRRLTTTSAPPA